MKSPRPILAVLLVIFGLSSSSLAQIQPEALEPPDLFNGRATLIPNTNIIPVEPVVNVIQPIQQILETACAGVTGVGGNTAKQLAFLCTARDIVNHAVETIQGLNQDLTNYANRAANGLLDSAATAFGDTLGLNAVNAGMQNIKTIVTNTTGQARAALEKSIDGLFARSVRNLFARDPQRPLSDPKNLGALARMMSPEAASTAIELEQRQQGLLKMQGNASITLNQARARAAELAGNRSATELNALVNTPITGRAASLEQRVGAAVSSREAIQRMTEGIADVMSTIATANSQVNASIASLAEQNVYTLQELQSLVELESQKELANLEASQRGAEAAMLNAWEEAQGMHAMATSASRGLYGLGNDQARGLAVLP